MKSPALKTAGKISAGRLASIRSVKGDSMTDITIPPEAAKALAMAILEITGEGIDMEEASAACIAMLKAWPGMEWKLYWRSLDEIILPLPTENTNDQA